MRLVVRDLDVVLATDRSVFSFRRIDQGTTVLLGHLDPLPAGPILDLGCGYGPLALALAHRRPEAVVWAVDINERALELAEANAHALGLGNVRVARPAEVPSGLRFDAIYSNPPIRVGKTRLHELLVTWLDRLSPAGRGRLVVQKHLGSDSLARWLSGQGYPTTRLASEQAYRVLEVTGRASAEQH